MTQDEQDERRILLRRVTEHSAAVESAALPEAARSLLRTDLTLQQLKVLTLLLAQVEDPAIGGLADTLGVSRASMTTMIDRLVATDAVARDVDPADHRVRHIRVTDTGRALVRRLLGARPEYGEQVLARLTTGDLRALDRGVTALLAAMDGDAVDRGGFDGADGGASS